MLGSGKSLTLCQKIFIPEHPKAGCQVSSRRAAFHYDLMGINVPLFRVLPQELDAVSQFL